MAQSFTDNSGEYPQESDVVVLDTKMDISQGIKT